MTQWLHFHFSLSCTGEGNGNQLQCSCLENPRDGGAWWAAVCEVAQSWTRLKQLSCSSSSSLPHLTLQFALSPWLGSLQSGQRTILIPKRISWTSLVVQWIGIHLPMKRTGVWSLVQEESACRGATKPMCHNYWAHAPWSLCSPTREATAISLCTTMKNSPCSPQLEKACTQRQDPVQPKINK